MCFCGQWTTQSMNRVILRYFVIGCRRGSTDSGPRTGRQRQPRAVVHAGDPAYTTHGVLRASQASMVQCTYQTVVLFTHPRASSNTESHQACCGCAGTAGLGALLGARDVPRRVRQPRRNELHVAAARLPGAPRPALTACQPQLPGSCQLPDSRQHVSPRRLRSKPAGCPSPKTTHAHF